jgi:hypothetical protein
MKQSNNRSKEVYTESDVVDMWMPGFRVRLNEVTRATAELEKYTESLSEAMEDMVGSPKS